MVGGIDKVERVSAQEPDVEEQRKRVAAFGTLRGEKDLTVGSNDIDAPVCL